MTRIESARGFWEKNQKIIIGISAVVIILIVGGWLVYKKFFKEPKEEKAAEAMFKAEEYFRNDSLNLALNGDGQNKGFFTLLKIMAEQNLLILLIFMQAMCFLRNQMILTMPLNT